MKTLANASSRAGGLLIQQNSLNPTHPVITLVMVGPPSSARALYVGNTASFMAMDVIVNGDVLGRQVGYVEIVEEFISKGKSVVEGSTTTFPDVPSRFAEVVDNAGIPCRCSHLLTSMELACHLSLVRQTQTEGLAHRVPDRGSVCLRSSLKLPPRMKAFFKSFKLTLYPTLKALRDSCGITPLDGCVNL